MKHSEITNILEKIFSQESVSLVDDHNWQVVTRDIKLLVLLSQDQSWLRVLVPIASANEASPFFRELLEANFDDTHEVRYALNQEVLWVVFQHNFETLTEQDLQEAIAQLAYLNSLGLLGYFNQMIEDRLIQIVRVAKMQGQSKENTLQQLRRLYEEGLLGGIEQDPRERQQFIKAWEDQLERLWPQL